MIGGVVVSAELIFLRCSQATMLGVLGFDANGHGIDPQNQPDANAD